MVKNKFGGKGAKRQSNKNSDTSSRKLLLKEASQEYGKIIKCLGNCKFEVFGMDGKPYLGILRGNMKKKVWVNVNNYVLFTYRDFQDNKVDIIYKFHDDETRRLIKLGEINEKLNDTPSDKNKHKDDNISFEFDDI